jgi:hypothetical protein
LTQYFRGAKVDGTSNRGANWANATIDRPVVVRG